MCLNCIGQNIFITELPYREVGLSALIPSKTAGFDWLVLCPLVVNSYYSDWGILASALLVCQNEDNCHGLGLPVHSYYTY